MTARNYQISITVTGYDKASGPLGGVKNALGGIGTIAGGILTAGVLTSIARQIADLGRQALDSYANYERLGMALQSLVARELLNTGQATDMAQAMGMAGDKAKELQGWITKLAIQSPFTQDDIANSFRLAMAYGFTSDEAKRLTTAMTDFAAGSGASSDTMNRIALALGQIKAKGKLAGQEMLQLTEAGLDVRGILAKAFGKTTEEIVAMQEKGLIPANKAIEAIVKSLEEDFGGAAARQAGTFSGLLASMEDLKTVGLRTFFEGTFKAIQPYVQKFVDTLSDPAFMSKLSELGQKFGGFVAIALEGFSKLQGDIQLLRAKLEIFMQTPAFKKIFENFKKIFDTLTNPTIMANAGRVFDGIKNFLQDLGEKVIPFATQMFDKISGWFEENGPLITAYVATMSDVFLNYFLPALMTVWNVAQPLLQGLIDLVLNLVTFWMQVFTGDIPGAMQTLGVLVSGVFLAIWNAIVAFLEGIASMMGTSLAQIGAVWSSNWEQLNQILFTLFTKVETTVKTAMENVKNAIASYGVKLQTTGASIINSLKSGFQSAFSGLTSSFWTLGETIVAALKGGIGEAFADLLEWFSGLLAQLLDFEMPEVPSSTTLGGTYGNGNYGSGYGKVASEYSQQDNSHKYYAPVYVTVAEQEPGLAGILKGTRSR